VHGLDTHDDAPPDGRLSAKELSAFAVPLCDPLYPILKRSSAGGILAVAEALLFGSGGWDAPAFLDAMATRGTGGVHEKARRTIEHGGAANVAEAMAVSIAYLELAPKGAFARSKDEL